MVPLFVCLPKLKCSNGFFHVIKTRKLGWGASKGLLILIFVRVSLWFEKMPFKLVLVLKCNSQNVSLGAEAKPLVKG